ncbi:MAG: acetate--CoA ligase family protein, partial [Candidatus Nanohaloarchaea archaeon]
IAVVGASREKGKTGHEVFHNLLHGFEGEVVPVNPNADEVSGKKARDEVPEGTDLAVVVVPAEVVPDVLRDAGEKDVDAAIVISAGFSETGNTELEEEVRGIAEHEGIALLGPNVLGLINTENSMNASFASKMPEEGEISFMSQSGAFCTAILDYAKAEHIGFRHFVSLGNKAMLNEVDFLDHWQEDPTKTVIGYTEGIDNGREFLETARETSKSIPIVMVKSGRSDEGGEAASSHTGSIAGSYEAYKAAFRQAGVVEAESSRELLDYGRSFAYQVPPEGKNVAVVTNAGGPGVITTDEIAEHGLELAELSEETRGRLEEALPDEAAPENPVDVIGDAGHDRYREALEAVLEDGNVDSVIAILTPQANTEIDKTARTVVKASDEHSGKPVMASFMGEKDVASGVEILERGNIPDFEDPMDAVKSLEAMHGYRKYRETEKTFREIELDREAAEDAVQGLPGFDARQQLFDAYGFTLPLAEVAETPKDAVDALQKVGKPAVMKVEAPDIHHKTDMDGVRTGLGTKKEVRDAFNEIYDNVYHDTGGKEIDGMLVQEELSGLEVAVGMKRDPQFGPMVMVGLGGIYIEALNDVSFGIAPVSEQEAERMIQQLQSHELFEGVRGEEHSLEPVKDAIIALGQLGLDFPEIQSVDINPLILREDRAYAADVKVELDG